MISEEIRNKAFLLFGDAFQHYIRQAPKGKLRIDDAYFHLITPEIASHLWQAHIPLMDSFENREEWMELVGMTMFISYMGMPVSDIITTMQSHFDEQEWDFMLLEEAGYSLVSPADLLLGYGRYELFDYDIERMAIGLKLLIYNHLDLSELSSIAADMAERSEQMLWQNWNDAITHKLEVSEDADFETQLKQVFLYNLNLFYDFADQDNFDQDDRMYPILTSELAEHLIAQNAVADAEEWRKSVGHHVYIWQYDMDNLLSPDEILQCDDFTEGQWYFMTMQDAHNFLQDVTDNISQAAHVTVVHLWWTGSMLYFLEKNISDE